MAWIPGPPPYIAASTTLSSRPVWLLMHDQGGYPFVTLGYLHGEQPEGWKDEHRLRMKWLNDGMQGPKPTRSPLVPWLRMAASGHDTPLSDYWNIGGHMEISIPAIKQVETI